MKSNKQTALYKLKQAYQENLLTIGKHSLQAYQDLRHDYNEATPEQWERLSIEAIETFDHLRSLLIRAEYLERKSDINNVLESENIAIKLERHQYAPEMNKAYFYRKQYKTLISLGNVSTPQATTIGEAVEALTGAQLKNLCLYA